MQLKKRRKRLKILTVVLVVAMVFGSAPIVALAADPEPFNIVEARLVTEVLDWGETITAVRIEYNDEIYCGSIWHSLEYANEMTYKIVSKRDIVNIYVNNSGKKDDIQLQGKYVFINLGIENEDYNTYRDQIVFQDGRRTRTQPIPFYLVQNVPITSVNGKVAAARAFSTASSAMTAAKNAALPDMNGTLGDNVREIRTASTEVRVDVDNFRTFEYTNPVVGTKLKFHLYIPPGYEAPRADNTSPALPMVVHFANSGDMNYDDDTHMPNIADRRYLGALFTHPDATYWATESAQERNPSFVLSLAGPNGGTYGGDLPAANWGNWYDNSQMQRDFMAAVRWVKERFKVDEDRVGAINLAGSTGAMLGTILSDDVDDFSACILTAYDLYHVFASGNLGTPIGGTPQTTYEGRMQYAETQFSKVMNKMATWQFAGLNDRTGVVSGDTTYVGYDDTYPGRFKGERMLDFAYRMNLAAEKTVVVANGYDNMWNGLINAAPSSNQSLKGPENEIKAQAQWDEAKRVGSEHLVTVYMPGTVMESMHWSWNPAYGNLVVQDWLYAQNRKTHTSFPIGPGAADYTPQSPRTPFIPPDDAEAARMVEARIVTEVLDWGETITAIRIEYSEEVRVDAVEYSEEHANRMTYQMATNRDIVNLYVNNSGKKDDYQTQGKYVFINLGQVNGDFTSYRDQVVFEEGLRIRARPEPYYLFQAFPITTVNGNVIQPRVITTATSAIRGTLIDTSELPDITQMNVWSTEMRVDIDGFRSFIYTNQANGSLTKFHLYIPPGYEKKDANLSDIPIIVHFPAGDTRYVDDNLGDVDASRQMGSLFSHNDATIWASEKSQAMQKAFVLTPGPNWNDNYMFIVKALVENLNIDISRIYAVSLASGTTPMWNTILANPGVFAGQLNCSYDPYHSFAGGSGTYEDRAKNAEDTFARIVDQLPGWFFASLNDASGSPVSGDPLARVKGERWRDLGFLMNDNGYNIDISWGQNGELMWNGMLRGQKAEDIARAQLNRANAGEAEQLITLFIPNTILQSAHWSWMASYTNPVVREWLFAQTNPEPAGTANIVAPGKETLSSDATLKTLAVSIGDIAPVFSTETTEYAVSVANSVSSITITATTNHDGATVVGTGKKDNLKVGENTFVITVTAEDETVKEYTVTVTRAAGPSGPSGPSGSGGGGGSTSTIAEPTVPLAEPIPFAPFITGFENNTFRGSQPITREQFVAILYRLNAEQASYSGDPSFKDVRASRWSYDAIEWANEEGIIEADEDGNFRPAAALTRADMAVMFVKVENLTEVAENIFSDIDDHPAADDILKAVAVGIFTGYEDGTFRPDGNTTRNEAVTALVRYLMGGEPKDATWQGLVLTFTDVAKTDWAFKYIALAVIGNSLPPEK